MGHRGYSLLALLTLLLVYSLNAVVAWAMLAILFAAVMLRRHRAAGWSRGSLSLAEGRDRADGLGMDSMPRGTSVAIPDLNGGGCRSR